MASIGICFDQSARPELARCRTSGCTGRSAIAGKEGAESLIHAGSGGVGTFAIQLAKHLGASVATTTGTANIELIKCLGADVVIDYKKQDFEKVLSG